MVRIPTAQLSRFLFTGQLPRRGCLQLRRCPISPLISHTRQAFSTAPTTPPSTEPAVVPLRKQLKDQAKAAKLAGAPKKKIKKTDNQTVPGWDLTVGIEIHAQLNTPSKLFSPASAPSSGEDAIPPNTRVAPFDLAIPGSQPLFQPTTLIPAIRAALALNCQIQPISKFDRKHYFHWDQPSGYQITQYYHPFARSGKVTLLPRDGIAAEDGDVVEVGIKQVQMEQDTAKTLAQPNSTHFLDFNRVGVPLVEIITEPCIHRPATAAAFVRKVQMLLKSVDACTSGLEQGGLRADVNVSVKRTGETQLGTRTEIKNLSSFKAVEDAIIAERDRQISVLEAGGKIEGETRGWSLGSTETRRLRGKEGEVDYRYMPDPDLGPVVISEDLVKTLGRTMEALPDEEVEVLMRKYGLSERDAMALMLMEGRLEYFYGVLEELERMLGVTAAEDGEQKHASLAANWCLHELGKLSEAEDIVETATEVVDITSQVPEQDLAAILFYLHEKKITAKVAKDLLWDVFRGTVVTGGITEQIDSQDLWYKEISEAEYISIADEVIASQEKVLQDFLKFKQGKSKAYPQGKLGFLVGKMMRAGPEQGKGMDPSSAERVMRSRIEEVYIPRLESSAPSTWSTTAFKPLISQGPKILPAVVVKLALNPEDAAAVHLYNHLEKDSTFLISSALPVAAVLELNVDRNRAVRNAPMDWAEHCDMVKLHSSSIAYTQCEEFDELVALGPPVIPQLMLRYKSRDDLVALFAYELLHCILWGHETREWTVDMKMQFDMWVEWFEKGAWDEAPHYRSREQRKDGRHV
ncbi:GatB/GatE catalytic domain-containing protein [Triangularia verruculosa]|uniref:Glutamyl-tRNA(Gln) amidotransferase subunit B, mitochondrial n=1 Tax=Triangularia verruculosa TaxID=2587418 RepID=A0AAN7APJ2_9PEZI|nr:GatB/GatE catalytic domain-containing protein [Triangularia verruculosa]